VQPELHQERKHQALHAFYQELLTLRRTIPTLTDPQASREVMGLEDERVIILQVHAWGGDAETLAILSFADTETQVSLPLLAGAWVKRLDASEPRFLGDGPVVPDRVYSDGRIELTVPPHAALLFGRTH